MREFHVKVARAIALCLLTGFGVTVAIAWFAGAVGAQPIITSSTPRVDLRNAALAPPRPFRAFGTRLRFEDFQVDWRRGATGWLVDREQFELMERVQMRPSPGRDSWTTLHVEAYRCGWPMRALEWCDTFAMQSPLNRNQGSTFDRVWEFGVGYRSRAAWGDEDSWRRLAVRPVDRGLGLVVDTLAWGAVASVTMGVGVGLKGRRRRRTGLCMKCGYPVVDPAGKALARCPECGAEVRSAA